MEPIKIQNEVLCHLLLDSSDQNKNAAVDVLLQYFVTNHDIPEFVQNCTKDKLNKYFMPAFKSRWKRSFYSIEQFFSQKSRDSWLNEYFEIPVVRSSERENEKKRKDFAVCSESTKRRRSEEVIKSMTTEEIEHLFFTMLRASGKKDIIPSIKKLVHCNETSEIQIDVPEKLSCDEALGLIVQCGLTKAQYNVIREKSKEKKADIFPHYTKIADAKKNCYPPQTSIVISEISAQINLQNLLDHTISRLIQVEGVDITTSSEIKQIVCESKWGADGTSGFNPFKQIFMQEQNADKYLFLMSLVPLVPPSSNLT